MFMPTSRYYAIETASLEMPVGRKVTYLRRRFIPGANRFSVLQEHTVTAGERLDNITAQYLGDPEQFHMLCDANNAMHPLELTNTVGRKLRITLPEDIPGPEEQ